MIVLITWCFGTLNFMQLADRKSRKIIHNIVVCVSFASTVLFDADLLIQALQTNSANGARKNNNDQVNRNFGCSKNVRLQCDNIGIGMLHGNVDWFFPICSRSVMFCLMFEKQTNDCRVLFIAGQMQRCITTFIDAIDMATIYEKILARHHRALFEKRRIKHLLSIMKQKQTHR